ncbi:LamG-like jellyroll fold domain-containing protein, partial [Pseudaestuariivita atlantica]
SGEFTVWIDDGKLVVAIADGNVTHHLTVPRLILDDAQTYHLAVSTGPDGLEVWLDGQLVAADPEITVGLRLNDESLLIGATRAWTSADRDPHSVTEGTIGDVRIYDRQLDERHIVTLAGAADPDMGAAASTEMQMADLAPVFEQLDSATDTLLTILDERGVTEEGDLMQPLDRLQTFGVGSSNIRGGAGADGLNAGGGNDTVNGLLGDDILQGGYGNDIVNGGDGNDIIDGGHGEDVLRG